MPFGQLSLAEGEQVFPRILARTLCNSHYSKDLRLRRDSCAKFRHGGCAI
jgi:hypothetical protein